MNIGLIFIESIIPIAVWIVTGLGGFAICRNYRIDNAWMSWIPVFRLHPLGLLVDDEVSIGETKITGLSRKFLVLGVTAIISTLIILISYFLYDRSKLNVGLNLSTPAMIGLFVGIIALVIVALCLLILYWITLYRIFTLYTPGYETILIIISIILSLFFLSGIIIFIIRNNERLDEDYEVQEDVESRGRYEVGGVNYNETDLFGKRKPRDDDVFYGDF